MRPLWSYGVDGAEPPDRKPRTAFTTIAALTRARGGGAAMMMALAARCELRGGARQPSGFNNSVRGVGGAMLLDPLGPMVRPPAAPSISI